MRNRFKSIIIENVFNDVRIQGKDCIVKCRNILREWKKKSHWFTHTPHCVKWAIKKKWRRRKLNNIKTVYSMQKYENNELKINI